MFLFFTWILSEFINNIWSWKNSQTTNKDKSSHRIIIFATYAMLFVVFLFRSLEIGIFNGDAQYVGFILILFGTFSVNGQSGSLVSTLLYAYRFVIKQSL
jgi:hypothetical protein